MFHINKCLSAVCLCSDTVLRHFRRLSLLESQSYIAVFGTFVPRDLPFSQNTLAK